MSDSSETNYTSSHFMMNLPPQSAFEKGMMFISPPGGGRRSPAFNIGSMIDIPDRNLVASELSENDILIPPTLCPETTVDSLILFCLTQYIFTINVYDSESCKSITERVQKGVEASKSNFSAGFERSPLLREMILIEDPSILKSHSDMKKNPEWRSTNNCVVIVHTMFRKVLPPKIEEDGMPFFHRGLVRIGTVQWYDPGSKIGAIRPDKSNDPEILLFKDDNTLVKKGYSRGEHVAFRTSWTKNNQTNIVNRRATIENVTIPLMED